MQTITTRKDLESTLASIPPLQLLGLALLEERQAGPGFFPANHDPGRLAEATVELIAYMRACQDMTERLHTLPPVPLDWFIPELSL